MPARRIKIEPYKFPYKDWALNGHKPPQDLAPLQPFWQKILPEDNEKAVSVLISDDFIISPYKMSMMSWMGSISGSKSSSCPSRMPWSELMQHVMNCAMEMK